jgi:CelD/BcsL family acetyltransferase involved in cellulose biosynthesis
MASYDQTIGNPGTHYPFQASYDATRSTNGPPLRGARRNGQADASDVEIAVFGLIQAGDHAAAWRDLAARALERNVFYEPDFALAAARHLREAPRPAFVFAWDAQRPRGEPGSLLGVFPVAMPSLGFGTIELFGWRHDQGVLGTPLLDAQRAADVVEQFFTWMAGVTPLAGGILLPYMAENGPAAEVIAAVAERTGRLIRRFGQHERAVLRGGESPEALLARALPGRRRKEIRRLRRRLEERGEVALVSAASPHEVRDAAEMFLDLEEAGWKGRAGSAFLHTASGASFFRAATRSLAAQGACRIDVLTVAGKPAAAAVMLGEGDRAFYWKTAFDETLSGFSPGVHLSLEVTRRQLAQPGLALTDSCAVPDHPMISSLWPDRIAIADWFIPATPDSNAAGLVIARETATRRLRKTARTMLSRLRHGKRRQD